MATDDLFSYAPDPDFEEEDFTDDEPIQEPYRISDTIILTYGTESVKVNVTEERFVGKTISQIVAEFAEELGYARDPDALNYKATGTLIEPTEVPVGGTEYNVSARVDTKG